MSARPFIAEEELHAFIDGELDQARRDAIERILREDAALAERVAKYRKDNERLVSIYAPLLDRPLPRSWEVRIRQGRMGLPPLQGLAAITAIAASILLVIGGVWLASGVSPPQTRSLVGEALAARSGDLRPEAIISSGVDVFSAGHAVSTALAMKAKAPVLTRFGYHLSAVKSFETDSRHRSVELVYANAGGHVLTLYVSRSVGAPRFDQFESDGLRICIWQDDVVGMVISGHLSAAEMQRLATLAYEGLAA